MELVVTPGWPVARVDGHVGPGVVGGRGRRGRTPWRLLDGPVQRGRDALARRRLAGLRAEALLWAWLSAEQRAQYRARGWFEVTTAAGRRYRIRPGGVMGLEPRRVYYCIEATSPVPVADEMLAYKLLLETDERRFLATAHRSPDL